MLLVLNVLNWIRGNWKLAAFIAIIATSFGFGWYARGYIADAEQNAAIVAAIEATKAEEAKLYAKEKASLERDIKRREQARRNTIGIYQSVGDRECSDRVAPSDWLQLIRAAYGNGTGE